MRERMDTFTKAFLQAGLWCCTTPDGTPMDYLFDLGDIAEETISWAAEECERFQEEHWDLLECLDSAQAGHDFWLTRNHEGTGYWDRGLGEIGHKLTEAAHDRGECLLEHEVVDGWIYHFAG